MKKTVCLFAFTILAACGSQGSSNTPPGCREVSDKSLRCEEPYGGAAFCCDAMGAEPYTCWDPSSTPSMPSTCVGSPFDPGDTDGSGSGGMTSATSTSGGSATATTGAPWCEQDCPEEMGGTCPGHAEWDRGIMIWGIYQPNGSNGQPDTSAAFSVTHQDPVCAPSLSICYPYMHPDDIPALEGEMTMLQLAACNDLTDSELAGLGLDDTSIGQYGWSLVDHVCVQGTQLNFTYQGQTFGATATASQSSCLGPWKYEGYCSASDCPDGDGGSVDSTGTSSGAGLDCAPFDSSDIDVSRTGKWDRDVQVRGAAADTLVADPYSAMWYCSGAQIDNGGKLYDLPRGSLFSDMGLMQDDTIKAIDGVSSSSGAMMEAAANAVNLGNSFDITIGRGSKILTYTVTVTPTP